MTKCVQHGLAAADDGLCVLCRRDRRAAEGPMLPGQAVSAKARGVFVVGAGILLTCGVAAWARSRALAADLRAAEEASRASADELAGSQAVKVTIYTTAWCPYCRKAKQFLIERGVAFDEKDVESNKTNAATAHALSGSRGVPVIQVDDEVLSGFNERQLALALERAEKKRSGG